MERRTGRGTRPRHDSRGSGRPYAIGFLATALALMVPAGARTFAAGSEDGRVLSGLQSWIDGTRSLVCGFEQRLLSGALGAGTVEHGMLYVLKPGRMRWEYTKPEPKIALVDGDRTLLYLSDDRQLVRGRLDPGQDLLPSLLVGGRRIEEMFEAKVSPAERAVPAGTYRVTLVPKSQSEDFQEVTLTVSPPDFAIQEVEVLDPTGSRMEYRFSAMRRNTTVPESTFTFEAPPGTEIVGPR